MAYEPDNGGGLVAMLFGAIIGTILIACFIWLWTATGPNCLAADPAWIGFCADAKEGR